MDDRPKVCSMQVYIEVGSEVPGKEKEELQKKADDGSDEKDGIYLQLGSELNDFEED